MGLNPCLLSSLSFNEASSVEPNGLVAGELRSRQENRRRGFNTQPVLNYAPTCSRKLSFQKLRCLSKWKSSGTGVDKRLVIRGGTACYWECLKRSAGLHAPVQAGCCVLFGQKCASTCKWVRQNQSKSALSGLRLNFDFRSQTNSSYLLGRRTGLCGGIGPQARQYCYIHAGQPEAVSSTPCFWFAVASRGWKFDPISCQYCRPEEMSSSISEQQVWEWFRAPGPLRYALAVSVLVFHLFVSVACRWRSCNRSRR